VGVRAQVRDVARVDLYSKQVQSRVDSPAHQGRFAIDVLPRDARSRRHRQLARQEVLRTGDSLRKVLDSAAAAHSHVSRARRGSNLAGVISLEQIRRVMNEDLPDQIVAHDIMVAVFPRCLPSRHGRGLRALSERDLEELPVWDPPSGLVLGLISRSSSRALRRAHGDDATRD